MTEQTDPSRLYDCLEALRQKRPHIHCITNSVAQTFTANVLLAVGATPSMTIALSEVRDFVNRADGLLVNLGTMDDQRKQAIEAGVAAAVSVNKPWALDPVFVQASAERLEFARTLLSKSPTLVRANDAEITALEATDFKGALVISGKRDLISIGNTSIDLNNGHPIMDRVTAIGCALTAVLLAFVAANEARGLALAAGVSVYNVAGEIAAEQSSGPGSFAAAFVDQLANIDRETFVERVKLP